MCTQQMSSLEVMQASASICALPEDVLRALAAFLPLSGLLVLMQ
jgi:hypothetical protein